MGRVVLERRVWLSNMLGAIGGNILPMLFVPADSKTNLRRNLANLTGPFVLNLSSCKDRPEEDQMAQALAWLKDHPGWFLILDNVDTEEAAAAVGEVLPQLHGGDVLITSRLRHWKPGVEKLELDVLKTADAQSLFRDLLKHQSPQRLLDSEADVDSLLRELDGLAVSIEHAAAYIACVGCSIAEFRRRLRIRDEHVREWHDPAVMVYPEALLPCGIQHWNGLKPIIQKALLCYASWHGS